MLRLLGITTVECDYNTVGNFIVRIQREKQILVSSLYAAKKSVIQGYTLHY